MAIFYIITAQYQLGRMYVYSSVSLEHVTKPFLTESLAMYFTQCNLFLHYYKAEKLKFTLYIEKQNC